MKSKIFINNKCIFLSENPNEFSGRNVKIYNYYTESALYTAIDEFEKDKQCEILNINISFETIMSLFPIIEAAGGVVRKGENQILFIYRYGKWDLPKGKSETYETPVETAIREVMEETGVNGLEITKELISTYHTYKIEGKRVIKKTRWFEMSFKDDSNILPQEIEKITAVKWLNKSDIPWVMRDSYASVIEVLTNAGHL